MLVGMAVVRLGTGEATDVYGLFPSGAPVNSTLTVTLLNRRDIGRLGIRADSPGLVFKARGDGAGFDLEVGTNVAVGPHLVRVYDSNGVSRPLGFVVSQMPELTLDAPKVAGDRVMSLSQLPMVVNGRFPTGGGSQAFEVELGASRVFDATLVANRLDSPLRIDLTLKDSDGKELSPILHTNDLDTHVAWTTATAGKYRLDLSRAAESSTNPPPPPESLGGVYRLTLQDDPLPAALTNQVQAPEVRVQSAYAYSSPVSFPSKVESRIEFPAERGRYAFHARQGEQFSFMVHAGTLDSPLIPMIEILDEAFFTIAQAGPGPELEMVWTAPAGGTYEFMITDSRGLGGSTYRYQIEFGTPVPGYRIVLNQHAVRLRVGETQKLTATVTHPRYARGVTQLLAIDLPEGVTGTGGPVPPDGGEVEVTISAGPSVQPSSQPFRVILMELGENVPRLTIARAPFEGHYAGRGELLLNESEQIWITVLAAR